MEKYFLIKRLGHFHLESRKPGASSLVGTIDGSKYYGKISLINCQSIEHGYDLDELIKNDYIKHSVKDDKLSLDEQIQRSGGFNVGYKEGFQKALELMGDDIFKWLSKKDYLSDDKDVLIEEYNQQSEWEVEILTEPMNLDEIKEQGKGFLNSNTRKPKLDSNGCFILKRIL